MVIGWYRYVVDYVLMRGGSRSMAQKLVQELLATIDEVYDNDNEDERVKTFLQFCQICAICIR